ncbi:MAG TPA: flagellar assembly protein FliH [Gammaproteobacteria bacterium]|nr:flagellar assembly protein FliH [Gammaproteobacteria bacterium]
MSTSKLIRDGELSAYERWELPHVDDPQKQAQEKAKAREEEVEAQALTAEQIEEIQKEAYAEAYASGYEKGREEGYAEWQRETQAAVQRLDQVFRSLARPLEDVDAAVEQELTELAIAIGRQLIRRELRANPEEIVGVVREALDALPSAAQGIRVFLHPDDAALVREALPVEEGGEAHWRIVEEPTLSRGGCRVESDNSGIDATVEKRLNAVVAELLGGERKSDRDDDSVEE